MSRTLKVLSLAVLLMSFGALGIAEHHEPAIYVWVNFLKAKPGQGNALTGVIIQEDGKSFDPLVESGAALEWGLAMPVVHDGNDPFTHAEWITFAGWDGVDQFMSAFMAKQQTMSPEEMAELDAKWDALVVDGSHADMINRSVHIGSQGPVRPGYIHLGYHSAAPGQTGEAMGAYKEVIVPVFDKLVADGAIQNYGMHVPAVHRNAGWTHMSWYATEKLAARDVVSSAFDAVEKESMGRVMSAFEPTHEDQILLVVHHKTPSGGGE